MFTGHSTNCGYREGLPGGTRTRTTWAVTRFCCKAPYLARVAGPKVPAAAAPRGSLWRRGARDSLYLLKRATGGMRALPLARPPVWSGVATVG